MVKDIKILVDSAEYFLQHHVVKLGKRTHIYLNDKRIKKHELGRLAFEYIEQNKPFAKKWATLQSDLINQILSLINDKKFHNN